MPSLLIGVCLAKLACGRCQLYRCCHRGRSAFLCSEFFKFGGVGPLSKCGLDEALGLTVGLRCVGFGADVLDAEPLASVAEGE